MASAAVANKVGSNMALECLAHVPGSSSATVVTPDGGTTKQWRSMTGGSRFAGFAVVAANAVLTGNGITKIEILGAEDSAGTNAQVIVDSGTLAGTAVGNGGMVECTAEMVKEVANATGKNLIYVAGRITVANSSDKCAVTYLRHGPANAQSGLTPATF